MRVHCVNSRIRMVYRNEGVRLQVRWPCQAIIARFGLSQGPLRMLSLGCLRGSVAARTRALPRSKTETDCVDPSKGVGTKMYMYGEVMRSERTVNSDIYLWYVPTQQI